MKATGLRNIRRGKLSSMARSRKIIVKYLLNLDGQINQNKLNKILTFISNKPPNTCLSKLHLNFAVKEVSTCTTIGFTVSFYR